MVVMNGSQKLGNLYFLRVTMGMLDGDALLVLDVRSVDDVVFLGSVS